MCAFGLFYRTWVSASMPLGFGGAHQIGAIFSCPKSEMYAGALLAVNLVLRYIQASLEIAG